ncbi:MAG: GntR family transcriptional regulator, partial [Terracidiphilus sp.]
MATISSGIFPVVRIDRDEKAPLHHQVYVGFRDAILRGELSPGQQVPSSRALAEDLEISRFPVLDAYARLHAEGYFRSRPGSRTFVSPSLTQLGGVGPASVDDAAGERENPGVY